MSGGPLGVAAVVPVAAVILVAAVVSAVAPVGLGGDR
jgi:hypothetical protein